MFVKHTSQQPPYTLGLDIGIASVGWCLLQTDNLIDLGVRAFDKAESEKGESLNTTRREKRLMRRRLRRRAHRLLRARRLFKRAKLIPGDAPAHLNTPPHGIGPWELRAAGLERRLNDDEWARALYHLLKFRGFHSNRKSAAAEDQEAGKLLAGVDATQRLMREQGYRTPAELATRHQSFAAHKRNKAGDYGHTFARAALDDELRQLFTAQRGFGNPHADDDFATEVNALFAAQRPPMTAQNMRKLMGLCTFENRKQGAPRDEFRAPKRCHSAERFVWLSKLNNLYLMENGERRALTVGERNAVARLPFERNSVSYKTLRTALKKAGDFPDHVRFAGLSYRNDHKDPEAAKLMEAGGWHTLRSAYEKAGLHSAWQQLALNEPRLDAVACVLTLLKTDREIHDTLAGKTIDDPDIAALFPRAVIATLSAAPFSEAEIDALLAVNFKDFIQLSLTALGKLLPHLQQGQRFDQAATTVYGDHRATADTTKTRLLPPIDKNDIRNPVVFRALNQARKVVNAIVRQYGPPAAVHIELARDLSRPWDERQDIKKAQEKYRDQKDEDIQRFVAEFGFKPHPKHQDLLKWRLYREQDGKCAYSLQALDLNRLFEVGYAEIDHALPYSRSYDDGVNNKVLVATAQNRDKGNRTPYEYLDGAGDSPRWRAFEGWVETNKKFREAKRQRLLRKHFDERAAKDFKDRNLTDTRYICRYFKKLMEQHLQLAETGDAERCVVLSGQLTAFLRARWGLLKNREESDLHHAMDAAVVAACSHGLVKRLSDYSRRGELDMVRAGYVDPANGDVLDLPALRQLEERFPVPWDGFREALLARLAPHAESPVLVSRAPKRRNLGAAHQETIRSCKRMTSEGVSSVKTPLTRLRLVDLPRLAGRDDPRNQAFYALIEQRLRQHGGDGAKAFGPEQPPLRKPCHHGEGAVVRGVKLTETQKSGLPVRGGIADNERMIRVDVFTKSGKHYLVPVYVADVVRGELPNRAMVAHKPETEWDEMDETFEFLFSLYPNDFVVVRQKGQQQPLAGYFAGSDRASGNINLWVHDRCKSIGKDGLIRGIGVKTALSVEKYHVDVLGRIFKAKQEVRHGLAQRGGQ